METEHFDKLKSYFASAVADEIEKRRKATQAEPDALVQQALGISPVKWTANQKSAVHAEINRVMAERNR